MQKNIRSQLSPNSEYGLKITGNFSWGLKDRKADQKIADCLDLKNIDLKIRKGEFICVIGEVGSGKSNLLSAINGAMAYVAPELLSEQHTDFKKLESEVFNY